MGVEVLAPDTDYRLATLGVNDPVREIKPDGVFSGLAPAVGKSVVGGLAAVGRVFGDALAEAGKAETLNSMVYAPNVTQEDLRAVASAPAVMPYDEQLKALQDWAKLDPRVTGAGSMVAGGVARGLTIMGAGSLLGGPTAGAATLGVTEGYNQYRDLREQGVDQTTAAEVGLATGVMATAGAYLPSKITGDFAKTLIGVGMRAEVAGLETAANAAYKLGTVAAASKGVAGSLAYGTTINTGFGMASRAFTSKVLDAGGYHEMADQYRALDGEAVAADVILGLAFGGWSHIEGGVKKGVDEYVQRPTADLINRALDIRREEQINRGAAGIPTDLRTSTVDRDLQDRALASLLQNREVSIDPAEANTVVAGALADPERVQLHTELTDTMGALYGPLADGSEPVRVERPAEPYAEVSPPVMPTTAEGAAKGPQLEPMVQEQMGQIAARHADMDIQMPDGTMIKASELQQKIAENLALAETESKLHDVAVACFLRTL